MHARRRRPERRTSATWTLRRGYDATIRFAAFGSWPNGERPQAITLCADMVYLRRASSIEEAFGWMKTVAGQEKIKLRSRDRVGWAFTFAAADDLVRLANCWPCRHDRACS